MLTIRLQRTGTKNKPAFRVVLAEAYRSASKQVLEVLGHYNPKSKQFGIKDQERLTYWLGQHIQLSPTVHNLFVENKLITEKKVKAWQPKKKEKATEAIAPKAEDPAAPAEPVAVEAPSESATEEPKAPAPVEEPKVEPTA